jgi:predicted acylesterase/phospholipase RssA
MGKLAHEALQRLATAAWRTVDRRDDAGLTRFIEEYADTGEIAEASTVLAALRAEDQMVWKIQVAFQGGGARFIQLLAVAEALQDLERAGKIKITRVAGTSAGAFVAALVAGNIPIASASALLNEKQRRILRSLRPPSKLSMAWRFARHKPLLDHRTLSKIISDTWTQLCRMPMRLFRDLDKKLIIVAADIVQKTPKEFSAPDEAIIEALVNSTAIPVVLRTLTDLSANQRWVDGALVDNLPAEALLRGKHEYGDVVAVTFGERNRRYLPVNQISYIMSLFDTATAHATARTKELLNDRHVFSIKSDLNVLDFDKAFKRYGAGSTNYDDLKRRVTTWGRNNAEIFSAGQRGNEPEAVEENPSAWTMTEGLARIWATQHAKRRYGVLRRYIMVTAHSLLKYYAPTDARSEYPDTVRQVQYIEPLEETIYCVPFRLDWGGQEALNSARAIRVSDAANRIIKCVVLPVQSLGTRPRTSNTHEGLIFFERPLQKRADITFPVQIRDESLIYGVMDDLGARRTDYISLWNHLGPTWTIADLILAVPTNTPRIVATWRTAEGGNFVGGRELETSELGMYQDSTTHGFRVVGWRTELPVGKRFYANLSLA